MFSKTIFKQTVKSNIKLWLIFTSIICVLNVVLISIFDDSTINSMSEMVKGTPLESFLEKTTFLGMLAQTFYSLHGVILPIIFIVMTANSLIAAQVDRGSMAYLLSTPIKRSTIVMTQACYLILAVLIMCLLATSVGITAIHIFQADLVFNMNDYLMLNLGLFLLMFTISSISFFFSCLFNLSKNSLALGSGIPLVFFLFQLMSTVDSSLENLKYITINALFDTNAILEGKGYALQFFILPIVGIVLYTVSIKVFKEKDLPL
ncbi:ABC transporter permease [Paenibacillus endoradicis]|uniref:ABC transporter permease n=1 Tax=Paenibacillus endoradicis TaxID=2972487 RepID=UPI0021598124|nr:ABC transporter permease [Paenibacillus endoradicis]MCR8657700.1 ABC transporter permease [Paenibacillus endoradicis]